MKRLFIQLLALAVSVMTGCSTDPVADRIWCGDLYRMEDGERLSEVCMKLSGDTLRIYSNAIFGKQNEVLLCTGFHDGAYRYVNSAGTEFRLRPARQGENISLFGSDFSMELAPLQGDWQAARAFYQSQNVPRNADSYLFGTYVGRAKGGVPMANTLGIMFGMQSGFMDMQIIATLSFSEGNRCKCTTEILWDDPQISTMLIMSGKDIREKSSKIYKYKVEGNRVILDQKGGTYYIQADGSLFLPGANDGYARLDDMILHKQQ